MLVHIAPRSLYHLLGNVISAAVALCLSILTCSPNMSFPAGLVSENAGSLKNWNCGHHPPQLPPQCRRSWLFHFVLCVCVPFQFVENADEGEDERSIAAHVAMLAVQAAKKDPDSALISSRMERTYADRRAMVYNGISTQDIMHKYPTLKFTDQVRMCCVSVHSVIFICCKIFMIRSFPVAVWRSWQRSWSDQVSYSMPGRLVLG